MNTLLQWFVTSSVLILAVLALRRLLGGRISPRVKYALWGVVLLRLLLPCQIPMPNLPTAADLTPEPTSLTQTTIPILPSSYSMEEVEAGQAPNLYLNDQGQVHTANSTGTVKPSADGQRAVFSPVWLSPAQLLLGVWGAGAVILALVLLGSNLRFSAKLRRRRTSLDLDDCPLPVYIVESLPSPCLFGLFRPCIYLTPQLTLDSPTRAHVLAHELTHYRQKDHIWSALRCLALALHWYNPLVWLAAALSKRDGELSCDAGAIKALGDEERIPYGRTLVSLVAQRSLRPEDLLSCSTSMVEGKGSIQERIAQLVKHPKAKKTALAAAVVLLALAAVFTFGGSQNQPEDVSQDGDTSYWDQVENAQSIRYSPPLYSSAAYPDAIADADLLQEAKTLLSQAKAPDSSTLDADWTEPLFSASTIALVNPDNSMSRYYLCTLDGRDYLVSPAQLDAEKYTPVAVFSWDAGTVEIALADLARQQSERNAAVSSEDASSSTPVTAHMVDQAQRLQNLEPDQIQSVYGGPYQKDSDLANSILTTLKEEANNLIPTPEPQLYDLYSLWEVYLQVDEENFWELSAGTVPSIVAVRIDQDTIYFQAPKLYDLIRQWWTPPENAITVTTPAVLQTMDQVLSEEKVTLQSSSDNPTVDSPAQLTALQRLATFDNQTDGSTVNIYGYDFGFALDDLSNISWTGDAWVDGQMLYHPDSTYHHLIIVEQNGKVAQYVTTTNDFPLDPESYAASTQSQLSLGEYAALLLGLKG